MPVASTRRTAVSAVTVGLALAVTAGCSGSSSAGGPTSPELTSPARSAEVFTGITQHLNHELQGTLPVMRGVQSVSYDPGDRKLRVSFTSDAVKLDQENVENIVSQARNGRIQPSSTPTVHS